MQEASSEEGIPLTQSSIPDMSGKPGGLSAEIEGIYRVEEAFGLYLKSLSEAEDFDREAFLAEQPPEIRQDLDRMIYLYDSVREKFGAAHTGLEAHHIVGDFRLVRQLGEGGMGEVWEAEQISLDRKVALKVLRPNGVMSPVARERFHREASAGGRIRHSGVAAVFSVAESAGVHFIAQELVEGAESLADRLDRIRRKPELPRNYYLQVADWMVQLCDALQAAHDCGVIHRDVKPANILFTLKGRLKVIDFGLAKLEGDLNLTHTGTYSGTYYYMSPEQAEGQGANVDQRTDIFSLGATFYEALTLNRPFNGDTSQQVCERVRMEEPPDPRSLSSMVPRELAVILQKAMQKHPSHRYQSMAEMGDDLRRFLRNEPILARPPGILIRTQKWMKRHPAKTGVGLTSLLLLGSVFWGLSVNIASNQSLAKQKLALEESADLQGQIFELFSPEVSPSGPPDIQQVRNLIQDAFDAGKIEYAPARAVMLHNIGKAFLGMGTYLQAIEILQESLAYFDEAGFESDLRGLECRETLGKAHRRANLYANAESHYLATLELIPENPKDEEEHWGCKELRARVQVGLASCYYQLGKLDAASQALTDAWPSIRDREFGADLFLEAGPIVAFLMLKQNKNASADTLVDSLLVLEEEYGRFDNNIIGAKHAKAVLEKLGGNLEYAMSLLEEAYELRKKTLGPNHSLTLVVSRQIGMVLAEGGQHQDGFERILDVLEAYRQLPEGFEIAKYQTMMKLGWIKYLMEDYGNAEYWLKLALNPLSERFGINHFDVLEGRRILALTLVKRQKYQEAEKLLVSLDLQFQDRADSAVYQAFLIKRSLGELYQNIPGRAGQADQYYRIAREMLLDRLEIYYAEQRKLLLLMTEYYFDQDLDLQAVEALNEALSITNKYYGIRSKEADEIRNWNIYKELQPQLDPEVAFPKETNSEVQDDQEEDQRGS